MYPVLKFGHWVLPVYGIISVAGFLFTYWFIKYYAIKEQFNYSKARDIYFYSACAALIGAKLVGIIVELPSIIEKPQLLKTMLISGGVFYGGLLSAILLLIFYSYYQKTNLLQLLDMISPLIALLITISRWGCFASGCCFGKPTDVPWAVTFKNPIAHALHPELPYVPIHPVQIYLSINSLIIFIILTLFYTKKKFHGMIFFGYLLLYGIGRFFIEYYRFDYRGVMLGGHLSTSQVIALISSFLSLLALLYLSRNAKKKQGIR